MRKPLPLAMATALVAGTAAAETPDYSLTIYSSAQPGQISTDRLANYGASLPGYALVRDGRKMALPSGRGELRFTDVATRIDPTTVAFESLTDPAGTRVLEQNYQYDLVNRDKLLERYVGEKITVEQLRGTELERISGTLLSAAGGSLILQRDSGEVVSLSNFSNVLFPSLPGGLITRPTLVWLVDAKRAGTHDTRVSYQTQGMTWWTDYNIALRESGDKCTMDLSSWVTIVNQSGGSFPAAQLKLVAGEVNRAPAAAQPQVRMMKAAGAARLEEADQGFAESSLFEYHLYTLGRRSDLPDNSTKQLELFPTAVDIACRKQLVFTAAPRPWSYWAQPIADQGYGASSDGTVGAYLEFENKEANQLGVPLPAGRMRVNQASGDGSLEFIGEDVIKHTPRNETVRIKLGNAFDIVGERRQTAFTMDSAGKIIDESFEISVRNRKKSAATVVVREYLYRWSTWKITAKNHDYEKRDAQTIDFPLVIPADGEAKLTYSVRYTW
ncbi:DUF4139 domain-containing protein [Dokdonella immobilis]|uniref:DUF4139 domain-containing protein n=1 Tax=Dokdonella immobilis TaxID=578942 RepID=A0A1I4VUI2_9GAMM|nr:DUF4139 domain-containing protein [Dokdonella immobilis]SFN04677.1 hypothetical protein SAMN05216289_10347 [Dokdonella immobilis]